MVTDPGAPWVPWSPTELDQKELKHRNEVLVPIGVQGAGQVRSPGRNDAWDIKEQDLGKEDNDFWHSILVVSYDASSVKQTDKHCVIKYSGESVQQSENWVQLLQPASGATQGAASRFFHSSRLTSPTGREVTVSGVYKNVLISFKIRIKKLNF